MTTYALVDAQGVVTNIILLEDSAAYETPEGLTLSKETDTPYEIGGTLLSGVYTPPARPAPPPPPVPQSISDRQFFQQLAVIGVITEADALASNAAVIPSPLLAIINAMPVSQQFAAKMLVSGATVFERNHPMTIAIGAAYGMTSEQIDEFFRAAAAL